MNFWKGPAQFPWTLIIRDRSQILDRLLRFQITMMVCSLPLKYLLLILTWNFTEPAVTFGPHLPAEYIKIIPHPHSPNLSTKIIALNAWNPACQSLHPSYMPQLEPCPWAPFENLADFEYTETAVLGLLPKWIINKQLTGFNSNWADGSHLTIKNFTEMDKVLSKARKYFVQVSRNQLPGSLLICSDGLTSSSKTLSQRLTKVKYLNSPSNIVIHGNGSCRLSKMSP
jgi:hypothetical protein